MDRGDYMKPITLKQFKKFADDNDILWYYNTKEKSKTPIVDMINNVTNFYNQKKEDRMKVNVEIAKLCHEANRQYCIDNQLTTNPVWDDCDAALQESIVSGVAEVINDPKTTPAEMHQNWIDYKEEQGWKYALNYDLKLKTHPNLVPFNKLPKFEQAKDKLFIKTVKEEMKK
jgi:hypothetical protein